MIMENSEAIQIAKNISAHDKIHNKYEKLHKKDIFNPTEQERLHNMLKKAVESIKTNSGLIRALDYGCGSGNLTNHLIELGLYTVAADVSKKFLNIVKNKWSHTGLLSTLEIDGKSLSNIETNYFDLVATYSVLHHVPDYLGIIKEMVRVLKPDGIIYIDYERNYSYWNKSKEYLEFLKLVELRTPKKWKKYLRPSNYLTKLRLIMNPRYRPQGDIHTFPDDHIEWDKIETLLKTYGCETVLREDYLHYRVEYPMDLYERYKNKCNDMRLLIYRKK